MLSKKTLVRKTKTSFLIKRVIDIDLIITKNNEDITLSDLGIFVQDVEYGSVQMEPNRRVVKGRSGVLHAGGRYASKPIWATGKIYASSLFKYQNLIDHVNGILIDTEPYYITQLLPTEDSLYDYENPGDSNGELDLLNIPHSKYDYRFKVISETGMETTFLGKSDAGLLFSFSIDFITAELPFGETVPKNIELTSNTFKYNGTAPNSQLEYPWELRLTADKTQPGNFIVELDGRLFEYDSDAEIKAGDVFKLKGIETLKNEENVTHYTNYEYFVLTPTLNGLNTLETNFEGTIKIINYVELYK